MTVSIEKPPNDAAETLAKMWVELASDQKNVGSHLCAETNLAAAEQTMLGHIVSKTVRIARVDGHIVGFVTYGAESESYQQDVDRGFIFNVFVKAPYRSQGIGTKLLGSAERHLAEMGFDVIALQLLAANDDAERFYNRHGYSPHRLELEKSTESDSLINDDH